MHKIISGCIEVLEQAEAFLCSSTQSSYQAITEPYFISSCGEHMRHVLDHFSAVSAHEQSGIIDYDSRQRGSDIETWLCSVDNEKLEAPLFVQTEVSISTQDISHTPSCLGRELIFASAHAIHHFSMMSIAMKMQNLQADTSFGMAPATQTHLRSVKCAP